MGHYVIIGSGDCPPEAVSESMRDTLSESDSVAIRWSSPMSDGLDSAFGFLLDHKIPTVIYYEDGQQVHPAFRESESCEVVKVRNALSTLIQSVEKKVLVMWNDDEYNIIEQVFDEVPGVEMLELSNGLSPIVISDEVVPQPVVETVVEEEEEEDDSRFTKEQLESMAVPAVKRYGEKMGCESKTKSGIISELFPDVDNVHQPEPEHFPAPNSAGEPDYVKELREITNALNDFYSQSPKGFSAEIAYAKIKEARAWVLRALSGD